MIVMSATDYAALQARNLITLVKVARADRGRMPVADMIERAADVPDYEASLLPYLGGQPVVVFDGIDKIMTDILRERIKMVAATSLQMVAAMKEQGDQA